MLDIKALISDKNRLDRAQLLHQAEAWIYAAAHDDIAFGEMQNGYEIAHRLAWHFTENWWHCSCSFYPRPCVHLITLALDFEAGKLDAQPSPPAWVFPNKKGTSAPSEAPLLLKEKKRSAEQIKRKQIRKEKAALGLIELETWLSDLVRRGIAPTLSEDSDWNAAFASRMADASMSSLSRRIRMFGANTPLDALPNQLGALWLAKQAFEREAELDDLLFSDVLRFLGATEVRKKDIHAQEAPIRDAWLVMGSITLQVEDALRERRTWLYGHQSKNYAILIDFAFAGAEFPTPFRLHTVVETSLYFYPSAYPQRALMDEEQNVKPQTIEQVYTYDSIAAFRKKYATAIAANPWLQFFPVMLKDMTPFRDKKGRFYLKDKSATSIQLKDDEQNNWALLAVSGGAALRVFGEWDGHSFQVLEF